MAVTAQQLTQLYLAYFGRPPDFDGMVYYTTQSSLTLQQVAANFSASPESQALYGNTTTAQLINSIYNNLFNRDAEPDGLLYWSTEIAAGRITPAFAAYAILIGAQNQDLVTVNNKMAVATAWFNALDTSDEITGYAGDDAAAVARDFLATVDNTAASVSNATANLNAAIQAAIDAAPDTEVPITLAISAPTLTEGNVGTKTLAFTLTLSRESTEPITVSYTTVNSGAGAGTATAGEDFEATAGSITFLPGQTVAVVNVTVTSDITVEDDETVVLQVTTSDLAANPPLASATITNDDITPQLTTQIDTISVAGTGANVVKGIVDGTTPANSTFSVGDTVNGNGQTVVELAVVVGGTGAFAYLNDVAAVNVVAGVGTAISFNALNWDVDAVNLSAGVNGLTVHLTSLNNDADLGIGASVGGQISATYQDGMYADIWNFGLGGAQYEAGADNVTIHLNTDGTAAGAFFSSSNDLTLGQIVIDGGADSASAFFGASVFNSQDLTVGGIDMEVGNSSTANAALFATGDIMVGAVEMVAGDTGNAWMTVTGSGDITLSSVGQVVGDSGSAFVSVTSNGGGDVTVGGIAQVGGESADAWAWIFGDGSVNVGSISQTVGGTTGTSSTASITITNSSTGSGDLTVGSIAQDAGVSGSALAYVYEFANGDLSVGMNGGVSQAGGFVSASISTTGSGDVTVGDVTQTATTSGAYLYVYADEGSIVVGNVDQSAATSASFSADLSGSSTGDVTIGNVMQNAGTWAYFYAYADGTTTDGEGGDVTVAGISQTVGDSGSASISIDADFGGVVDVGNITQVAGSSASAYVWIYGDSDVSVGNVDVTIGDSTGTTSASASVSITGSGDITVGDISVVVGNNNNAYAYVSNSGTGDVLIGNVTVHGGDNTNTVTANSPNATFEAFNFNATGDLTVGNVDMYVGDTGDGILTVSLTGTTNESLGNLEVGDVMIEMADKASITVNIIASHMASTTTSATNVVDVGTLTVGDINLVAGTQATFDLEIDHQLNQATTDVGGDLGATTVGKVTIAGGVGADVDIDYTISNSVEYTTVDGDVISGGVGDVTLGGFDIVVDDGGSVSVSVDIYASGAIGDVDLGDLKAAVGVSGSVSNFDVSVTGQSVGNVTVGDVSLIVGEDGNANGGIAVSVSATAGGIGDVNVGDINWFVDQSGDIQTISMNFTATGDIGDIMVGDLTQWVGVSASIDGLNFSVSAASGDIASFEIGSLQADLMTGASVSTMMNIHLTADNIGAIKVGDIEVNVGASASADSLTISATASGDIASFEIGAMHFHVTDASGVVEGVFVTASAGGTLGDVTVGDIEVDVVTSASFSSGLYFNFVGVDGVGDVTFADVDIVATAQSGSDVYVSVNVDATSGSIGDVEFGDLTFSEVSSTGYVQLYVTMSASDEIGDVKLGNVGMSASSGEAYATFEFAAGDVGNLTIEDIDLAATNGGRVYFEVDLATMTSEDVATIGTISFSGDSTTVSVTASILAGTADVSIDGVTVHGTGAAQFGTEYFLNVTGGDIHIDTIKLEVTAATSAYNVTSILGGVAATGTITIGTVDYSGWEATATGQAGETIDVSAFAGDIVVIGTGRDDTIIGNGEDNTFTGGDGDDTFDVWTNVTMQNIDAIADARIIVTITDFDAGNDSNETIDVDADVQDVAHYAEKTATSVDNFITVALAAMTDPVNEADIVAVQVGADVYVAIDMDGGDNIDAIIRLVGVTAAGDNTKLNFADFS